MIFRRCKLRHGNLPRDIVFLHKNPGTAAISNVLGISGAPALCTSVHTRRLGDYTQNSGSSVSGSISRG
jgi:hypothetical protein